MSLSGFIRGGISVLTAIIALYIMENTFGSAMDKLYGSFSSILSHLSMTTQWKGIAILSLGGWGWFDRAFVICIIAVFIWWASLIFVDVDYGRRTN